MAESVEIQTRKIVNGEWQQLPDTKTTRDGQATLVAKVDLQDGGYFEVLVYLGKYFNQFELALPQIKLVDIVPLRFGIEDSSEDIKLLMSVSPHSYTAGFSTEIKD